MSRIPTNDHWHGTYREGFAELSTHNPMPYREGRKPQWRILISGNDDFAMYRDFDSREAFLAALQRVPVVVDKDTLYGLGYSAY